MSLEDPRRRRYAIDLGRAFAPTALPSPDGAIDPDDRYDFLGLAPETGPDIVGTPPVALLSVIKDVFPALALLIQQYRDKPNLAAFISSFADEIDALRDVGADLFLKRSIDTAEGAQLDVVGKIVVLDRPYLDQDIDDAFEIGSIAEIPEPDDYEQIAYDEMHGISALGRPDIGGRLLSLSPLAGVLVDDDLYRRHLRAKIIRNTTDGTIPSLIRYFSFVFDAVVTIIPGAGVVNIGIDRAISVRERALVEGVPVAGGIRVGRITTGFGPGPFGFAGSAGNTGFGSIADVTPEGSGFVTVLT